MADALTTLDSDAADFADESNFDLPFEADIQASIPRVLNTLLSVMDTDIDDPEGPPNTPAELESWLVVLREETNASSSEGTPKLQLGYTHPVSTDGETVDMLDISVDLLCQESDDDGSIYITFKLVGADRYVEFGVDKPFDGMPGDTDEEDDQSTAFCLMGKLPNDVEHYTFYTSDAIELCSTQPDLGRLLLQVMSALQNFFTPEEEWKRNLLKGWHDELQAVEPSKRLVTDRWRCLESFDVSRATSN